MAIRFGTPHELAVIYKGRLLPLIVGNSLMKVTANCLEPKLLLFIERKLFVSLLDGSEKTPHPPI